jgi:serine/threonine-protein kinase
MTKRDALAGQVVDDRYRLEHPIGKGGMSVVYLAEDVDSGRPTAIKFLRSAFASLPDFVDRFEQEAQACSRLDHPNCLRVMGYGVAFGSPYLAMEYIKGRTLAQALIQGPFSPRSSIEISRQILDGLHHAHSRGVVHRDLKPGNIMLNQQNQGNDWVKIMDFGTAQLLTDEQRDRKLGGTDVGTPWYMAPEQAAGQPTDQRTDLYAVGIMLFEMLAGERPYTAEDPMRVLQMHLSSPIPSARVLRPDLGLSPELETVMVKAMQKQPDDRFPSADAFSAALLKIPEVQPTSPSRALEPVVATDEWILPGTPLSQEIDLTQRILRDKKKLSAVIGLAALMLIGLVLLVVALTCDGSG